jgi:hypothetical protein
MKTVTWVAIAILLVGAYMEYQKDSSFASVDSGSLIMGVGGGLLIGHLL